MQSMSLFCGDVGGHANVGAFLNERPSLGSQLCIDSVNDAVVHQWIFHVRTLDSHKGLVMREIYLRVKVSDYFGGCGELRNGK